MCFSSPLFPHLPLTCEVNYCLLMAVGSEKAEEMCVIHHSKWGSHPAAAAAAENMLEMQTLGPHLRRTESEPLEGGTQESVFHKLSR